MADEKKGWRHNSKRGNEIPQKHCRLYVDRKNKEEIRKELKVTALNDKVTENRRRWSEHLNRMPEERLPVKAWKYKSKGRRDVGRLRERWEPEQIDWKPNPRSEEGEEVKNMVNVWSFISGVWLALQHSVLSVTVCENCYIL